MADLVQSKILTRIVHERERQGVLWGDRRTPAIQWVALLTEELGEVAKAVMEGDVASYEAELVHLAAVAVAALEQEQKR